MTDKKISELTEVVTPAGTDVLPIVSGGETKKVTVDNLLAGATSPMLSASGVLTHSQIAGLGSGTTAEIVAAPGVGKVAVPFFGRLVCDATAAAYTVDGGASIALAWVGGGDASSPLLEANFGVSTLLGADGEVTFAILPISSSVNGSATTAKPYDASEGENLPLGISGWNNGAGDFTDGDPANTLTVTILYSVIDV